VDGRTALAHAIVSIPVPGAPSPSADDGAAVGLSFLDTALRLNHVRRLTERLTVADHRVARRVTEIDVSLRMLDARQRKACAQCHELRGREEDPVPGELWVPVARLARSAASPVDVRDGHGTRLPRLTEHESSALVASGLFRLLRGILATLPDASGHTDLALLLHRAHEAEWLIQAAMETLLAERRRPEPTTRPEPPDGTVEGQGGRHRSLALRVLDKYEDELADYFALFDITRENELLIVCLDGAVDEHLLTFEAPLHVDHELPPRRRLQRLLGAAATGYCLEYGSHLPPGIPGYHLVVETEPDVAIDRLYVATDSDAATVAALHRDLAVLAPRLAAERASPAGRGPAKILELQAQTTLRRLADVVRRRRWECVQAGFHSPDERMLACTTLARIAVAGDGVVVGDGDVDSSILLHPLLTPDLLQQAAHELYAEEMFVDLTLQTDPPADRAHAYWRGPANGGGGAPVEVRAAMLLTDVSTTGPRSVGGYALATAVAGFLFAAVLAESPWPFSPAAAAALGSVAQADAVVAVLLLVPGFLYTRLALPAHDTVAGHLRALPRLVANACVGSVAVVAATIAAGLPGWCVQVAFALMILVPAAGVGLLLARRRRLSRAAELVRIGAPRWLAPGPVDRVSCDVRFFTPLGRDGR
jgi:hypothetical protein